MAKNVQTANELNKSGKVEKVKPGTDATPTNPETVEVKRPRGRPRKDGTVTANGDKGPVTIYKTSIGRFFLGAGVSGTGIFKKHDNSQAVTLLDELQIVVIEDENDVHFFTHSKTLKRSLGAVLANLNELGIQFDAGEEDEEEQA